MDYLEKYEVMGDVTYFGFFLFEREMQGFYIWNIINFDGRVHTWELSFCILYHKSNYSWTICLFSSGLVNNIHIWWCEQIRELKETTT